LHLHRPLQVLLLFLQIIVVLVVLVVLQFPYRTLFLRFPTTKVYLTSNSTTTTFLALALAATTMVDIQLTVVEAGILTRTYMES
jgi:hypothetical protein